METSEKTLSIIKPDAVRRNLIGKILTVFEENGLKIVQAKLQHLTIDLTRQFYIDHAKRPFYDELTQYMCQSPVFISVLEGVNAVSKNRDLMGATNPKEAKLGTIRQMYALNIGENSVHGSDSLEAATKEINFFFPLN